LWLHAEELLQGWLLLDELMHWVRMGSLLDPDGDLLRRVDFLYVVLKSALGAQRPGRSPVAE
jgi:hypothetical protein